MIQLFEVSGNRQQSLKIMKIRTRRWQSVINRLLHCLIMKKMIDVRDENIAHECA